MTTATQSTPISWRTLAVGGCLGYLLALLVTLCSLPSNVDKSSTTRQLDEAVMVEEEEEELDVMTLDTTVTILILLLISLTIAFEKAKEHIEETADRTMKPIIGSLFGEMTVLGFLSIFTFCVTRLGFFTQLSIQLFGEKEQEVLLETFEFVHYMLFFIMVFFVVSVLTLVAGAKEMGRTWKVANIACRDDDYMEQLKSIAGEEQDESGWISYLFQTLFPCFRSKTRRFHSELSLFYGIRQEFLIERSMETGAPHHEGERVSKDFHFGRYLSVCLGHTLGHVVEVNVLTWGFFALLTLVFYVVILAISSEVLAFAWVWAATGWLFFLFGNYFDYHILSILRTMAVPLSSGQSNASEASLLSPSLPAWTKIDLEQYMAHRPWLARRFVSGHATRQDSLYWMERKGPRLYLLIFQIQLVFASAYISLLLLTFYPYFMKEETVTRLILYLGVSILPIYFLLKKFQMSAANMTTVSSIGVHRRPHAVAQVIREIKTEGIIRAMVTMQKLQHAAHTGWLAAPSTTEYNTHSVELIEVAKTFDALDKSGDGMIEIAELKNVMHALGAPTTEESLQAMMELLDRNQDGHISKDEFVAFYSTNVVLEVDNHHGLHDLAKHMFEQFDQDGSGEITMGEFKQVVDAFNVGFTIDEIGDLVNELDEQDNGTITEHEFLELLKKHKHLFQRIKLPALE